MQIEEINDIEEETREKKIGKRGIKMTEKIKEEKGDWRREEINDI